MSPTTRISLSRRSHPSRDLGRLNKFGSSVFSEWEPAVENRLALLFCSGSFDLATSGLGLSGDQEIPARNDLVRALIASQPQEPGLAELAVAGPLGKLDLGNEYGIDPGTAFHDLWGDCLTPTQVAALPVRKTSTPVDLDLSSGEPAPTRGSNDDNKEKWLIATDQSILRFWPKPSTG
jgi:hypothetical protein